MPPHAERPTYHFQDLVPAAAAGPFSGLWTVPDTLPFLTGHFPEMPMVPAAVILEVSLAFLQSARGEPTLSVVRVRHCKFKAAVTPGMTLRLTLVATESGTWQCTWTPVNTAAPAAEATVQLELHTQLAPSAL